MERFAEVSWKLKSHFSLLGVIILVLALNLPLMFMIQWPHGWIPGLALLPIALADFLITIGAVRFVEKFIGN
ncbi:MAG: hypothetical protein WAM85_19465 [Terracidiphilus sp.]